ncbi:MAG: trypsin-like peptidase domain-containing protein [Bacillota bacterium]|nr:trypsin-like peptidase domain-containing protein [Bacillota bacterium]
MHDGWTFPRHLRHLLVAAGLAGLVGFAAPPGRLPPGAPGSLPGGRAGGTSAAGGEAVDGRLVVLQAAPYAQRSSPAPSQVGVEADYTAGDRAGSRTGTGTVVAAPLPGRPRRILVVTAAHVLGPPGSTWANVAVHLPGSPLALSVTRIFLADQLDLAILEVPSLDPNLVRPYPLPGEAGAPGAGATAAAAADPPVQAAVGEIDCVRGPTWSFQSFPVGFRGGGALATGPEGATVATDAPAALPGCSGGAVLILPSAGGLLESRWLGLLTRVGGGAGSASLSYVPAFQVARLVEAYDRATGGRGQAASPPEIAPGGAGGGPGGAPASARGGQAVPLR